MSASARTGPAWRTHQPVRRDSRPARDAYDYCQPIGREEAGKRRWALERYVERERMRRRQDKAWGPKGRIGDAALNLGRRMIQFMADATTAGRRVLAPSVKYLSDALGYDEKTIHRAKAELQRHGWLDWIRRFEPIADAAGAGPRVRQLTNAYRLLLPGAAAVFLGFLGKPAPVSADLQTLEEQAASAAAAAKAYELDQGRARQAASPAIQRAEARFAGDKPALSADGRPPLNR